MSKAFRNYSYHQKRRSPEIELGTIKHEAVTIHAYFWGQCTYSRIPCLMAVEDLLLGDLGAKGIHFRLLNNYDGLISSLILYTGFWSYRED